MWLRIFASRRINYRFCGGDRREMLCARAYRERNMFWIRIFNTVCYWDWGKDHCFESYVYEVMQGTYQKEKDMDHEEQRLLPLDERFRQAEQLALDLPETDQNRKKPPRPDIFVCIGNCNICPKCGNSNNRD